MCDKNSNELPAERKRSDKPRLRTNRRGMPSISKVRWLCGIALSLVFSLPAWCADFESVFLGNLNSNDLPAIRRVLKNEEAKEWLNREGRFILERAASQEKIDILEALLSKIVDPNAKDRGRTLLFDAINARQFSYAVLLLKKGADPNISSDPDSLMPMTVALNYSEKGLIQLLLDKGAKLDDTTVATAVQKQNAEALKLFLERGANPNAKDAKGTPILHAVIRTGDSDSLARLLEAGADVNATDANGNEALTAAIESRKIEFFKEMLAKGASFDKSNALNRTPLFSAASWGPEPVKILLDLGANPDTIDQDGLTPLFFAAFSRNPETVRLLLEAGVKVDIRSAEGYRLLDWAAYYGHVDFLKIFLDAGADILSKNDAGCSVLHYATLGDWIDVVKILVEAGVEVNALSSEGKTPLDQAAERGNTKVSRYLRSKGALSGSELKERGGKKKCTISWKHFS